MAISAAYENSASISTTEYSLPNNSTGLTPITVDGVYQTMIDFAAMLAGDEYEVKVYEKVNSGGTQRVMYYNKLIGAQTYPLTIPSLILLHGWDVTVKKLAGTDRSIVWSIRQVA